MGEKRPLTPTRLSVTYVDLPSVAWHEYDDGTVDAVHCGKVCRVYMDPRNGGPWSWYVRSGHGSLDPARGRAKTREDGQVLAILACEAVVVIRACEQQTTPPAGLVGLTMKDGFPDNIKVTTQRVHDGYHATARQPELQLETTVWGPNEHVALEALRRDPLVRSWSEAGKALAEERRAMDEERSLDEDRKFDHRK